MESIQQNYKDNFMERASSGSPSSYELGKSWSSLAPSDIIKLLIGGIRLTRAKSKDIFREAVWPRLLAKGWHSEQPKNQGYVNSTDYLVFLMPDVENSSRKRLVRGDHYFDSVSDVLSKVVAEPNLLELEEETKVGNCNEELETGSYEDDQKDISDRDATNQKEAYDNPHINASKMVESQQNQKTCVSDDNQLKRSRTIKHQYSRRPRSGHSDYADAVLPIKKRRSHSDDADAVLPIKKRRLTACAMAESSHIIEKSTGGLGSAEELALSKPENGEMMAMVEEDGHANDPSVGQPPNINPRRQSTRNRCLSVRALEFVANEFLHVQRRPKRKDIQINTDAFSPCPCRKKRTKRQNNDASSS